MSRPTIRIDVEDARELASLVGDEWPQNGANARLLAALARHDRYTPKPRRKPSRSVLRKWEALDSEPLKTGVLAVPALPYPKMVGEREKELRAGRDSKWVETQKIRDACFARAKGKCECGCGEAVGDDFRNSVYPEARGELDHMFGRGKGRLPQSVETCWVLRPDCHVAKTRNRPDAATWWRKFLAHIQRQTHGAFGRAMTPEWRRAWAEAEKRAAFVEVRRSLPAAPRL
jgi:hypothetical protein